MKKLLFLQALVLYLKISIPTPRRRFHDWLFRHYTDHNKPNWTGNPTMQNTTKRAKELLLQNRRCSPASSTTLPNNRKHRHLGEIACCKPAAVSHNQKKNPKISSTRKGEFHPTTLLHKLNRFLPGKHPHVAVFWQRRAVQARSTPYLSSQGLPRPVLEGSAAPPGSPQPSAPHGQHLRPLTPEVTFPFLPSQPLKILPPLPAAQHKERNINISLTFPSQFSVPR